MGRGPHWEITYVGPALAGKKTALQWMHKRNPDYSQEEIVSLPLKPSGEFCTFWTEYKKHERFFIRGFSGSCEQEEIKKFLFYEVNAMGRIVLGRGIIFVADSQASRMEDNVKALQELEEILANKKQNIGEVPVVFLWNKRDLSNVVEIAELEKTLNHHNAPSFASSITKGEGLIESLEACFKQMQLVRTRKNNETPPQTPK